MRGLMRVVLGLGGPGASAEYDWYVNSATGNDANAGNSPTKAFKTLSAAVAAVSSNETIALARGSVFDNERIILDATQNNITITTFGEGDKPVIDGSAVHTTWAKTDGKTNVYEKTLTLTADPSSHIIVFEDGAYLTRAASLVACDGAAGSYFAVNETTDTITVYVHATGGGDPDSNGKEYRVTEQLACLWCNDSADISVFNVVMRRSRFQSGSCFGSKRFYAEGCEMRQGSYHNAVIALSGTSTLKDCVIADSAFASASTLVAFYEPETDANDHILVDGCTFSNAGGPGTNISGFNYHDGGDSIMGSVTVINTTFEDLVTPCSPNSNTPLFTFTNNVLDGCQAGVTIPTGVTAEIDTLTGTVTTGVGVLISGGAVTVANVTLSGGSDGIQVTGGTVTIDDCEITGATRGYNLDAPVTLTGCAATTCGRGYDVDNASGTVALVGCSDTGSTVVGLDKAGNGSLAVSGASSFSTAYLSAGTITVTGTAETNVTFTGGTLSNAITVSGAPTVALTHVTATGLGASGYAGLWIQGGAAVVTVDGGTYTVSDALNGTNARSIYTLAGIGATVSVQNAYIKCRSAVRVLKGGVTANVIAACDNNRYGVSCLIWDDPVAGSFAGLANWQAGTAWDDNSTQDVS